MRAPVPRRCFRRLTLRLAREFGFCYGVDRAVEYAYETRTKFPDRKLFLASEACDQVQGYFIGRPAPIQQYAELVGRDHAGAGIRKIG